MLGAPKREDRMRRGRAATGLVAVATAVVVASSGCSTGPTVGDGLLGSDWAVLPEPVVPTPAAGVCTLGIGESAEWTMNFASAPDIGCAEEHDAETVHIGTLPGGGEDAGSEPPELGDELFRDAYADCVGAADSFLGGDFHTARVFLIPVLPNVRQWAGGARWYRCELIEISNANGTVVRRKGSLRDGLKGARPMAIGCGNELRDSQDDSRIEEVAFVGCQTRHDVEMTGIYTAPDGPYPGHEQSHTKALDACFGIGAKYLGMTRAALDRTGGISWLAWHSGGEAAWVAGERTFWCFMGEYPYRKLRGSIQNRRPGSFPH
jgi:hypothetical protein